MVRSIFIIQYQEQQRRQYVKIVMLKYIKRFNSVKFNFPDDKDDVDIHWWSLQKFMKSSEADDYDLIANFSIQRFENNSGVFPVQIDCLETQLE